MTIESRLRCHACGAEPPRASPFRCPQSGQDDADHLIIRELSFWEALPLDGDPNPYVRFRERTHAYHVALSAGLSDDDFVALVRELDAKVAAVDGRGFAVTPFARAPALEDKLLDGSALWLKDETGNVSGSHKARHLFGVMLHLRVLERIGDLKQRPPLAISSCGNAALAAAVVARAAEWPLSVYVPTTAAPAVLERLEALGATLNVCTRDSAVPGDPCTHAFRAAVAEGAIPFSCQGTDNGIAVEGGLTLGYEIVTALIREQVEVDHLFVQVGGGALGSAVMQAFREAAGAEQIDWLPRMHTVQTKGAAPLARAYDRVLPGIDLEVPDESEARALVLATAPPGVIDGPLRNAVLHRSEFMWPWESEPQSVAHGILDDETYDWLALLDGMLTTAGRPLVVSEDRLREANDLARALTDAPVDHTGTAGLAGLIYARRSGVIDDGESAIVLFTGHDRQRRQD